MSPELKAKIDKFRELEKTRTYSGWSPARTEALKLIDEVITELSNKE